MNDEHDNSQTDREILRRFESHAHDGYVTHSHHYADDHVGVGRNFSGDAEQFPEDEGPDGRWAGHGYGGKVMAEADAELPGILAAMESTPELPGRQLLIRHDMTDVDVVMAVSKVIGTERWDSICFRWTLDHPDPAPRPRPAVRQHVIPGLREWYAKKLADGFTREAPPER